MKKGVLVVSKHQVFRCISVLFLSVVSQVVYSDPRIERLEKQLEEQLKINQIPGFAIVIVENGEAILARGFGIKSIEEALPVTKNTIFPINSLSKPITSIVAGIRVGENAIDWDENLANYLPNYKFSQPSQTVPITLRDALSHRTGYGRNDTLWANPQIARRDIIKFAPLAKPLAPHREEFHYNNVMYLAVGMATAHDREFDWDTILKDKLLIPLGMDSTTTDYTNVTSSGRLANGYFFSDIEKKHIRVVHQNRSNIAPATGIYSSASDMEKLLKFLLSGRNSHGKSLIKQKTLAEMFKPTTTVSPTFSYGLGWYISEYNGEKLLDHSGNGEGFSSTMALLPESSIGFVLLTNVSITPLQASSINLIFDALTKEDLNEKNERLDIDYSQFVGEYLANFWQFQNVNFTFKIHGGKPALDIPGQTLYMLKPPDAEGKFYFEITNNVAVSFILDDQNNVVSLKHHEAGEEFVLPKKVSSIEMEKEALSLSKKTADALYEKIDLHQQKSNFEKLGTLEIQGTLLQEQSGVSGRFKLVTNKLDWHLTQNLGMFGYLETKTAANGGFNKRLRHEYQLKSYLNQQARREHPFNFLYWDELYETVFLKTDVEHNIVVTLDSADLSSVTATINESSALVEEISMQFIDPIWGTYPRKLSYSEYRQYCDVNIPIVFAIDDHEIGNTIFKVSKITSDKCDVLTIKH
jgi:CubicO group peptidase (beta-lactamase class C family)